MSHLDDLISQARAREDATVAALDRIKVPEEGWDIPAAFRRPMPVWQPPAANAFREMLTQWPAWERVVGQVSREHPAVADPQAIYGAAVAVGRERLSALLFAHQCGDTLAESEQILEELLDLAEVGLRPRTGTELGLRPEMFGEGQR